MVVSGLGGVVKDGVIVPDSPLPEGAYVEITVPNAPRDIVERVRERTTPESALVGATHIKIDPLIEPFLRYHNAEPVFAALRKSIETCFPGMRALVCELEEDYDVQGMLHVICRIILPADSDLERRNQQRREFNQRYQEVVPTALKRLFVPLTEFAPE
jgi:hypothetical protein